MKALIVLSLLAIAGCATAPVAPPRAPFERCMDQLGYKFHYTSDMIRAADWCAKNGNGGIE